MTDNTQHGRGWSGLLVLNGNHDVSPIYKQMLGDAPYCMVYGDTKAGNIAFKEVQADTAQVEVVAHVAQKLPIQPFALFMVGDAPLTTHVPTRGTTVAVWGQGHITGGFQRPVELLIELNREPAGLDTTYSALLQERVLDHLTGKFAMCIGYFSRHPRVVLATHNMELSTWLVFYNGVYMYVWSTDPTLMSRVIGSFAPEQRSGILAHHLTMDACSLMVIHPQFWITKFSKFMSKNTNRSKPLNVLAFMYNYLTRQCQSQAQIGAPENMDHGACMADEQQEQT